MTRLLPAALLRRRDYNHSARTRGRAGHAAAGRENRVALRSRTRSQACSCCASPARPETRCARFFSATSISAIASTSSPATRPGFPDTPTAGKNGNYPLYARLGAVALVQATPTATGLHVAVHDVAQQKVARVKDFNIDGAPNSREWRMSVHNVSDELEAWITGVRGIAATRVAYVQGVRNGRLCVIDSDGAFPTAVGDDAGAMSPAWHPKGTHIAYSVVGSRGCCQIYRLRLRVRQRAPDRGGGRRLEQHARVRA